MRSAWSIGIEVHEGEARSLEEFSAFVTSLESRIVEPTVVELWEPGSGASCSILVGCTAGSVLTYQATQDPPYYISVGAPAKTGPIVTVRHCGELIEYSARQLVPTAAVLPFIHSFWASRERGNNVLWEEL